MQSLSPTKTNIILQLAKYKFLTISQLLRLGVATQRSNITTNLSRLKKGRHPFIGQMNFPFVPGHGRAENFYFLKPKTKEILIEELLMDEERIKVPKGSSVTFTSDYFHRKYTIDTMIDVNQQAERCGERIIWFDYYFDQTTGVSKGTRAKNKIDLQEGTYLIPDAIFVKETEKGKELWLVEVFNDKEANRPYETLLKHREALILGSPSIKYGVETANRVLCVFTNENVLTKANKLLNNDEKFNNFKKLFNLLLF